MMTRKDFVVQYVLMAAATRTRARGSLVVSSLIAEADKVFTDLGDDTYFQTKEN